MNIYREAFTHIRQFPKTFWVVIFATLMNQAGNMAFVFLVLYMTQHIGTSLSQASIAFAVFSGSMLVSSSIGGSIIDKFGAVKTMIVPLILNGTILLIFPSVSHYFSILVLCLLWGIAYGIYRPASQTFITQLSHPGIHKLTFSIYRLAMNLGMSIGPAVGGYLAGHSYASIFIVNGVANLLASIVLFLGLYHTPWFHLRSTAKRKLQFNLKILRYDTKLLLFVLGMVPIAMVFFQHESTLPVFLNRDLHFPLSFYGILFSINTLMIVFVELALNVAMMHWQYRTNFILGSFLITLGFVGMCIASLEWHVIALTVIWTLGEMIMFPSAGSYIADIAPAEHRGTYMSLYTTTSNIGLLIGPWSGAIIMDYFSANGLWLTCGLWGIMSLILFYYLREPPLEEARVETLSSEMT